MPQPSDRAAAAQSPSDPVDDVIPRGTRFEGLLGFRGTARVEGTLRGEIVATGTLEIGESALVEARVEVDEVVIAGILEGEVRARRRIELLSTASVRGNLQAPRFALAEGCMFRGRCTTLPNPSSS